jgi:hypothetical protein
MAKAHAMITCLKISQIGPSGFKISQDWSLIEIHMLMESSWNGKAAQFHYTDGSTIPHDSHKPSQNSSICDFVASHLFSR